MFRTIAHIAAQVPPSDTAEPFPWLTVVLPVAIAGVGLLGVFGAALIAARSAIVIRLVDANKVEAEEHRAFQRIVVKAINELGIAQGQWIAAIKDAFASAISAVPTGVTEMKLSIPAGPHTSRIVIATQSWREAFAEAHLFADEETVHAMEAYDARRAVIVDALNANRIDEAERENALLLEYDTRQIYRYLQLTKVKTELAIIGPMRAIRLRRKLSETSNELVANHNKVVKWIEEADKQHKGTLA